VLSPVKGEGEISCRARFAERSAASAAPECDVEEDDKEDGGMDTEKDEESAEGAAIDAFAIEAASKRGGAFAEAAAGCDGRLGGALSSQTTLVAEMRTLRFFI
jgi:hypothetical protein